jgi:DNA polymerase III gamma/tau subunit
MQALYGQYRPRTWAEVVGQDKVISRAQTVGRRGFGGRAYIIGEAHGLRRNIIRKLLVLLESLPDHVAFIFTTTVDGQESLFEEQLDAGPLLSRCVPLALARRDLSKPFAARVREIATKEGLNGRPVKDYVRLAQTHRNNMRAMRGSVEAGGMME